MRSATLWSWARTDATAGGAVPPSESLQATPRVSAAASESRRRRRMSFGMGDVVPGGSSVDLLRAQLRGDRVEPPRELGEVTRRHPGEEVMLDVEEHVEGD